MQIVENKALVLRTRNPKKYALIPRSKVVGQVGNGVYEVAVHWGLDEARVLKNLGVRQVPSPILKTYKWPGRFTPFAHQKDTSSFFTLHKRGFCFSEPGTGKTLSALWAADYLMQIGEVRRVLILCPLSIMHSAWMADLHSSILHRSAVICHHSKADRRREIVRQNYEFVIANYDGLPLIADEIQKDGRFDLIIADECFVAGTQITTPTGAVAIETLQAGDEVLTSVGVKRIKRLIRNTTKTLVEVKISNGKKIRCTPEHPFFTDIGWVTAKNLEGRRLVHAFELPDVQQEFPPAEVPLEFSSAQEYPYWADMLKILRTEEVPSVKSRRKLLQQNEARREGIPKGRKAQCRVSYKNVFADEEQKAQAKNSRRKWHRYDGMRAFSQHLFTKNFQLELPRSVGWKAEELSYLLQARLCRSNKEAWFGDRRKFPQYVHPQAAGSKENGKIEYARVESVTYIKCTSKTPVFNLEIADVPNYCVEGFVVHNCNAYKNVTTKRWKTLAKLITPQTYLWMMTGTPAAQSPEDAYGLAKLVSPTRVPAFFTGWKDKVMRRLTRFKWIPKPDAYEQVHSALQPAIRFTKAECLDLPPVMTETRIVPMTPQQSRYYKMMKERMVMQAAGETITAINAAAGINKLLQISAGAAYTDTKEVVDFDCTPRLNVLLEVLEETQRKVLVFALYRHNIDAIEQFLLRHNIKVEKITGATTPTKRTAIFNAFQTTDSPRVLVIQPQAAQHGVTLTAADTVVLWGPVMSVESYVQCVARTDRQGQTSDKVTVVHLQGSPVEEKMFKRLQGKVEDHALLMKIYEEELAS